jgi:DNA primase small subunit
VDPTSQAIQRKFQQYYLATTTRLGTPPRMEQREYGFLLFKEKFMVRHRAFKNPDSLLAAIRDLTPLHAYFSTGYYRDPTLPMEQKGWTGADLVFDIDADHLNTPCKTSHDSWKCKSCETSGQGSTPGLCPKCKNDRMETQTWLCEKCLQAAKEETQKLLEILYSDMGVDPEDVRIFFSGHRGYHVHVYSQDLVLLGESERREIVDYVLGQGLDAKLHDLEETTSRGVKIVEGPLMGQPGWRGRIVAGIYDLLGQEISQIGLSPIQTKSLQNLNREELLRKPFWNSVKGIGLTTWQTIALKAVEKNSSRIDTVVTTDVHRLIRLPGTLNGHTGLLSVSVPSDKLDQFDPFAESLAFRGKTRVRVKEAPEFRLGSSRYGPFKNETVELPEAGAVLLLCKRRAEPVT